LRGLFIILGQLRPDLKANLLPEVQSLHLILSVVRMCIGGSEVLLVGDLNPCEDGDDLGDADEIYLGLFFLDVQDLLLHTHIDEVNQLPLIETLLTHGYGTFHIGLTEQPSEKFLHLLADLIVGQHHPDQVDELEQPANIEDSRADQQFRVGRETVQVQSEGGSRHHRQDDRHPDHKPGHHPVLLELSTVQGNALGHIATVVAVGKEGKANECQ
jgi:hypothetical protein